jgi:hypothetical protein
MALDTSGNWSSGDDFRVLEALEMPFSEYILEGLRTCMAQLESIDADVVLQVQDALDRYEAARDAKKVADLANTENKLLVQADVLKWAAGNGMNGVVAELQTARELVMRYFDFCPYTPNSAESTGATQLIRS